MESEPVPAPTEAATPTTLSGAASSGAASSGAASSGAASSGAFVADAAKLDVVTAETASPVAVKSANLPIRLPAASMRASLLMAAVVVGVGAVTHLATFGHAPQSSRWSAVLAVVGVLFATLPALWFWALFSNGAARQMASIAWRFLAALFLLAIAANWEETARNCYFSVLLPCYFVALSLESWLLIRECQLNTD